MWQGNCTVDALAAAAELPLLEVASDGLPELDLPRATKAREADVSVLEQSPAKGIFGRLCQVWPAI